jgi:hypothetical protein
MSLPNTTYRILLEKLGDSNPAQFIGNEGEVFYDPNFPELKLSDGVTPGGVSFGSSESGSGSADTGNISFSAESIIGDVNEDFPLGVIQLIPSLDGEETPFVTNGQYVNIYPTFNDDAPHIHIAAGILSTTSNYYSNQLAGSISSFSYAPSTVIIEEANQSYVDVTASSANGFDAVFNVSRDSSGEVDSITIINPGQNYQVDEILTIDGSYVGGISGDDDILITISVVNEFTSLYLKGDLFLGDDDNYVKVQGNGGISLVSGTYASSIELNSDIVISADEDISITSSEEINIESSRTVLSGTYLSGFGVSNENHSVVVGLGTLSEFSEFLFTNKTENDPMVILGVVDTNEPSICTLGLFSEGLHFNQDFIIGKATQFGAVGGASSSIIYTSVGYGTHIGSVKLLVQGQGGNGGCQLSELSIVREYQGNIVYLNETSRVSGIGSVTFTASYNESLGIQVYADTNLDSTNDLWSFIICPTEIRQFITGIGG